MHNRNSELHEDVDPKRYDSVVIGGGLAGLTAAILLAERGQKVSLYERAATVGGRAQTRERDGYKFNFGPHALYRGNAGMRILKSMGIEISGKIPKYGKEPLALTPTESGLLPVTPLAMLRSKLFAGRRLALMRAMISLMTAKPESLQHVTWRDWLDQTIADERVRSMIEMLGRLSTYSNAPKLMSAAATLKQSKSALQSNVLYMDDGWAQMLDKLVERAQALGVTIHTGVAANQVAQVDEGVSISLAGVDHPVTADNVVVAIPPQAASKLMPQSKAFTNAIANIQPVLAACLTLGLRKLPNPNTLTAQGIGIPLYISVHSESAAELTPHGEVLLHAAVYIGLDDTRTPDEHRTFLEGWLAKVQPGWQDQVETSEYLPRMIVTHSYVEAAQERPAISIADLPNVYVVGDWVESGEMLADGSFASAQMAVNQIMGN